MIRAAATLATGVLALGCTPEARDVGPAPLVQGATEPVTASLPPLRSDRPFNVPGLNPPGGPLVTVLPEPAAPACPGDPTGPWLQDVRDCAGLSNAINIQPAVPDWLIEASTGQVLTDLDGDTWADALIVGPAGFSRVYLGSPEGLFTERGDPELLMVEGVSTVAVDTDDDGDLDVMVGGPGEDTLLLNTGAELVVAPGPSDPRITLGVTAADLDGDGKPELYTANYQCPTCELLDPQTLNQDGLWTQGVAGWEEVTDQALQPPGTRNGLGFLGLFSDFDHDGDQDIYVINDRGRDAPDDPAVPTLRNAYFRNDGPGCGAACFTEIARDNGSVGYLCAMGADSGDIDNDGDFDLVVSHVGAPDLYLNDGTGQFVEISDDIGLTEPVGINGWGVALFDVDNDGDLDIYQAASIQNRVFANEGGTFTMVTDQALPESTTQSRGVALADYDRDGHMDLLVGDPGGEYHLLRNTHDNDHHWLGLRLEGLSGTAGGRDALGAVVTVIDTSQRLQVREISAGRALGGGSDFGLHFGFGDALPSEVTIRWPDGTEVRIDVTPDRWNVVER